MEKVIVTGCAGFIGMHLCLKLIKNNFKVLGIDNLNSYYSVKLKRERLKKISKNKNFSFKKIDISNLKDIKQVFKEFRPSKVVNLAAQAGVRYSLENPHEYINSNISGL